METIITLQCPECKRRNYTTVKNKKNDLGNFVSKHGKENNVKLDQKDENLVNAANQFKAEK